ncbi:MAG TPA: DUF4184 family protein [Mucilaginibacter sp.]|nr:DUF4184 family protein [Mucilaginibacter sp.]
MPFTFSHPAAVLPFGAVFRRNLSLTGLVIGSMVPDFEYFIRMNMLSAVSHTWQGFVWFDLPLGFVLFIIYEFFVKDKLIARLPAGLNRRFYSFRGYRVHYTLGYLIAIVFSVALGAASHILWDGFTHPSGTFVHRIPYLRHLVRIHGHRFYIFTLLQYGSTVVGGLIVLASCLFLRKGELTRVKNATGYWLQILLVVVVVFAIKLATGMPLHQYVTVIITLIAGTFLGLLVASLLAE